MYLSGVPYPNSQRERTGRISNTDRIKVTFKLGIPPHLICIPVVAVAFAADSTSVNKSPVESLFGFPPHAE